MASITQERRLVSFPSQKLYSLTLAQADLNEMSRSEVVEAALRLYFDSMTEAEKRRLMQHLYIQKQAV